MPKLWVARLNISAAVTQKINSKHGVTVDEVRHALVCVGDLVGRSAFHPERGWRWYVEFELPRGRHIAVLYPAYDDADVFNLGTCFPCKQ